MYINTTTLQYPLSERDIRAAFPDTSFPVPFAAPDGYAWVFPTPTPAHNEITQYAREIAPAMTIKQTWQQQWELVDRYANQAEADAAVAADAMVKQAALQASIVQATQLRLDEFAQTRNYDGILSACTYATSTVPQFQAEGQACVEARDATWATLYSLLAEVNAGTRPMPGSYADIESLLPALAWPA